MRPSARNAALLLSSAAVLLVASPATGQPLPPVGEPEGVHLQWRPDLDQYEVRFQSSPPYQAFAAGYVDANGTAHELAAVMESAMLGPAGSAYWFRIPKDARSYSIAEREFAVAASPPPANASVRVAFLSDIGMTADTKANLDAVRAAGASAILAGGDLSYADGDEQAWDDWFGFMEPYVSDIPFIPARGNHEGRCLGAAGVAAVPDCKTDEDMFRLRFGNPYEDFYYATEWGPLRIIVLDTKAYYHRPEIGPLVPFNIDPDEQRSFLSDALRAPPGVWTVVMFHRPLYSSSGSHGSEQAIRAHIEPTLVAGGADLVLAGHDHDYERTWPVQAGEPTTTQGDTFLDTVPVHVVSGGGGQSLYQSWQPQPTWSAVRAAEFHFLQVDATPDQLTVAAVRPDGSLLDRFTLVRAPTQESAGTEPMPQAPLLALAALALGLALRRRLVA